MWSTFGMKGMEGEGEANSAAKGSTVCPSVPCGATFVRACVVHPDGLVNRVQAASLGEREDILLRSSFKDRS